MPAGGRPMETLVGRLQSQGPDLQNILRFIVRLCYVYDSDLQSVNISRRNIVTLALL